MPKTQELVMRWLPVENEHGRTRMEAVWILVPAGAPIPSATTTKAA